MIAHLANRDRLEGLAKYFLTVFESALWYLAHLNFEEDHDEKKKKKKRKKKEVVGLGLVEEEEEELLDLSGDEEETDDGATEEKGMRKGEAKEEQEDVVVDNVGGVKGPEEVEEATTIHVVKEMKARVRASRISTLERLSTTQEGRLKALDRMMQLNSMSLLSTERRVSNTGGFYTKVLLLDESETRSLRTVTQEVMDARRSSNL
jgi:hypothetical protein